MGKPSKKTTVFGAPFGDLSDDSDETPDETLDGCLIILLASTLFGAFVGLITLWSRGILDAVLASFFAFLIALSLSGLLVGVSARVQMKAKASGAKEAPQAPAGAPDGAGETTAENSPGV